MVPAGSPVLSAPSPDVTAMPVPVPDGEALPETTLRSPASHPPTCVSSAEPATHTPTRLGRAAVPVESSPTRLPAMRVPAAPPAAVPTTSTPVFQPPTTLPGATAAPVRASPTCVSSACSTSTPEPAEGPDGGIRPPGSSPIVLPTTRAPVVGWPPSPVSRTPAVVLRTTLPRTTRPAAPAASTPTPFGSAAVPAGATPIQFPSTTVPVASGPATWIPATVLPETTLRRTPAGPPMVTPGAFDTRRPTPLGSAASSGPMPNHDASTRCGPGPCTTSTAATVKPPNASPRTVLLSVAITSPRSTLPVTNTDGRAGRVSVAGAKSGSEVPSNTTGRSMTGRSDASAITCGPLPSMSNRTVTAASPSSARAASTAARSVHWVSGSAATASHTPSSGSASGRSRVSVTTRRGSLE